VNGEVHGEAMGWTMRIAAILTTMLHELCRRDGRYALEAMCVCGGQGLAALFSGA
jgi:acetyl-CoA C-acetyltransferase